MLRVTNLDALTYAGNLDNLADCAPDPRYRFVRGDICNPAAVAEALDAGADAIVNLAAETHVDRSILEPDAFLRTDILGTHVLWEAARERGIARFVQVSTDEVYGDIAVGTSRESDPLAPRSPYAASKAGGDLQVLAYAATYGLAVSITRGSNTYGPNQYPEKLIPLFVTNLLDGKPVPLYGDGMQVRDWMHVADHARGILDVLERGSAGEIYNIAAQSPQTNRDVTRSLAALCGRDYATFVRHVVDRPGHDRRYALDVAKVTALGWRPRETFEQGLAATVRWYAGNEAWWRRARSGHFEDYYRRQYAARGLA